MFHIWIDGGLLAFSLVIWVVNGYVRFSFSFVSVLDG